jgi:acyl-CoA reductase-like NAD-dependent aldehyde dehydrogenase
MTTATVEIPTHQQVLTFVSKPRKMLIGGKWLEAASGKTFPTYNPATGETLAHVAEGNSADVDKAHRGRTARRVGVDHLLQHLRRCAAFRRIQAIRVGPRNGP